MSIIAAENISKDYRVGASLQNNFPKLQTWTNAPLGENTKTQFQGSEAVLEPGWQGWRSLQGRLKVRKS